MAKGLLYGKMDKSSKDSIKMIKNMEKANFNLRMGLVWKEIGYKANFMGRVNIITNKGNANKYNGIWVSK